MAMALEAEPAFVFNLLLPLPSPANKQFEGKLNVVSMYVPRGTYRQPLPLLVMVAMALTNGAVSSVVPSPFAPKSLTFNPNAVLPAITGE
jgi:hypothetical protein